MQGSPIGGGDTPTPWGRSAKFTKLANSSLFSNFFVSLIQNDKTMEFFAM